MIAFIFVSVSAHAEVIRMSPIYTMHSGYLQLDSRLGGGSNGNDIGMAYESKYKGQFLSQGYIAKPWLSNLQVKQQFTVHHQDVVQKDVPGILNASALSELTLTFLPTSLFPLTTGFSLQPIIRATGSDYAPLNWKKDFYISQKYTPRNTANQYTTRFTLADAYEGDRSTSSTMDWNSSLQWVDDIQVLSANIDWQKSQYQTDVNQKPVTDGTIELFSRHRINSARKFSGASFIQLYDDTLYLPESEQSQDLQVSLAYQVPATEDNKTSFQTSFRLQEDLKDPLQQRTTYLSTRFLIEPVARSFIAYDFSQSVNMSVGSIEKSDTNSLTANYRSKTHALPSMEYTNTLSGNLAHTNYTGDDPSDSVSKGSIRFGQRLLKQLQFRNDRNGAISLEQNIEVLKSDFSKSDQTQRLTHRLSLTLPTEHGHSYARAEDHQYMGNTLSDLQNAQQINIGKQYYNAISGYKTLSIETSGEYRREDYIGSDKDNFGHQLRAAITYISNHYNDIPNLNLNFTFDISESTNSLDHSNMLWVHNVDLASEFRVNYKLGQLSINGSGRLHINKESDGIMYKVSLRRNF